MAGQKRMVPLLTMLSIAAGCELIAGVGDPQIAFVATTTGGEETITATNTTSAQTTGPDPACDDKKKSGMETDTDCGGDECPPCGWGRACKQDDDCRSKLCTAQVCVPTCLDGETSGDETGIDCGGPTCGACVNGETCKVIGDYQSRLCRDGVCTDPHVWSERFGGAGFQWMTSLAVDEVDRTIITGFFDGAVSFGETELSSPAGYDVFLAKLDTDGTHLWSKSFGTGGDQRATAVATGLGGAVAIAGYFDGNISFGGAPLNSTDATDLFVAKFNATGGHVWSLAFGGTGAQVANTVAFGAAGDIIVGGSFESSVNFGGGGLNSAGGSDAIIVRFSMNGNWYWNKQLGGTGHDYVSSLAVDTSKNLIAVGSFQGTVNFGDGSVESAGGYDGFVVKYDPSGNHLWSKRFGGSGNDFSPVVAIDKLGNLYVAGSFTDAVELGCGTKTPAGNEDTYVAKLDPGGVCQWIRTFPSTIQPRLAIDGNGRIGLTGRLIGDLDLGFGTLHAPGMVLLKLDTDGIPLWGRAFADPQGNQAFAAIGFDGLNDARVAGHFTSTINLGGEKLVSAEAQDLFLGRLTLP